MLALAPTRHGKSKHAEMNEEAAVIGEASSVRGHDIRQRRLQRKGETEETEETEKMSWMIAFHLNT